VQTAGRFAGNSGAKKDEEYFDPTVLNDVAGWLHMTLRDDFSKYGNTSSIYALSSIFFSSPYVRVR
jgi:hypothetical protein